MKPQEIREKFSKQSACLEYDIQIEICAQLAELNDNLEKFQKLMIIVSNLDEDCLKRRERS